MLRYLHFIKPLIATYFAFYVWWEVLPDGNYWWTAPTLLTLYVTVIITLFASVQSFSLSKKS